MDDHADPESFASYLRLSAHLNRIGLSAPRVAAADEASGLALVEDWGEATYARRLAAGADEEALYALATDALVHLQCHPQGAAVSCPRFDEQFLLDELRLGFCDWFVPVLSPGVDRVRFTRAFLALWRDALGPLVHTRHVLVLRDFHIDNLMELDGRPGVCRCGLLDFQDAVIGAPEYDLVSLLQDARRDLAPGLESRMLTRYLAAVPWGRAERGAVIARYHLAAAQRHTRIAGTFVRLWRRDGKPRYLAWLPRVLGQMERALRMAGLNDIRAFLDAELPDWRARGAGLAREANATPDADTAPRPASDIR